MLNEKVGLQDCIIQGLIALIYCSSFICCYDKNTLTKSNEGEKGIILASNTRSQSMTGEIKAAEDRLACNSMQHYLCGGLNENGFDRFMCLDTSSACGGTLGERLGSVDMVEEVYH